MRKVYRCVQLSYARLINKIIAKDEIVFIPWYMSKDFDFPMNACSSGLLGKFYYCELKDVPSKLVKILT